MRKIAETTQKKLMKKSLASRNFEAMKKLINMESFLEYGFSNTGELKLIPRQKVDKKKMAWGLLCALSEGVRQLKP